MKKYTFTKTLIFISLVGLAVYTGNAQNVGINTTGSTPSSNAILDLNTGFTSGTYNLGLIIPHHQLGASLTTFGMANAATTLDTGMLVFNMKSPTIQNQPVGLYYWGGAATGWVSLSGGGSMTATNAVNMATATNVQLGGNLINPTTTITNNGNVLKIAGSSATTTYASAGNVGIGGGGPSASAILDLTNTMAGSGTGAPLLWPTNPNPSVNITPAVLGEEVYNSSTGCFNFYNGSAWVVDGCPCTTSPAVPTITASCPFALQGTTTITYTSSITTGVTFSWSATSTVGTPTITGNGTSVITVTWPSSGAGTGTVTLVLANMCGTTTQTLSVPIYATPTMTVVTPLSTSSPNNIFSVPAMTGATYAWSFVTNTDGSTIVGSTTGSSVSVTTGATAGTFSLQCIITDGACGVIATLNSGTITVNACGIINIDGSPIAINMPTSPAITSITAGANEIILVTVFNNENCTSTAPTCTGAGAATLVTPLQCLNYYYGYTYGFVTTAAGAHTVTIPYTPTSTSWCCMYVAAFKGFCGTPTIGANIQVGAYRYSGTATNPSTTTPTITTSTAGSYVYGIVQNFTDNLTVGNMTWSAPLTKLNGQSPNYWDMGIGGGQIAAASTVVNETISDANVSYLAGDNVGILLSIHN